MLQALNLIEKTSLMNRKPGFKWLGFRGFQSFMAVHGQKTEKVFVVSRAEARTSPRTPTCCRTSPSQDLPKAKHFAPRVILNAAVVRDVFPAKKRRLGLSEGLCESVGKENINTMNQTRPMIGKNGGAFTKLRTLLEVVSKVDRKVQAKALRRRPLAESQCINLYATPY